MSIELRLRGVMCNIACKYCYQNAEREANNYSKKYDLDKVINILEERKEEFTLFGGEPLMLPLGDLERVFQWGFQNYGRNTIQTNGILIKDKHIELFKKYNVHVGLSIDGPGELNDVRWQRSLKQTRKNTAAVEALIPKLCDEGLTPSLIITLHRGNATKDKLPIMKDWMVALDKLPIVATRLHLLEVDEKVVRDDFALTTEENTEALLAFIDLEPKLKHMRFDITSDIRNLLLGRDDSASCVWRACDPFHTEAVRGLEGDGKESKCGRVNKEGIDYLRPERKGYERYIQLYNTEDEDGGCKSCRFFLMCKGQCPGTGIDGDWRKKSEHCGTWKHLFSFVEEQLVREGKTPLSLHPVRKRLERQMIAQWKYGNNPTISRLSWKEPQANGQYNFSRKVWLNKEMKSIWQPRFYQLGKTLSVLKDQLHTSFVDSYKLKELYGIEVPEDNDDQQKYELEKYLELGRAKGFLQEMEWLERLMNEKSVTSSINGILESTTPVMKLVTNN